MTVLGNRGRGHFVRIGRKGQSAMRQKYPDMARQWGKLGGRPRKPKLADAGEAAADRRKEDEDPPCWRLASPLLF